MLNGCDNDRLRDERQAGDYYDQRYTGEYMQDWPEAKLRRVAALIGSLGLPERGVAVDFGCGVGVFSRVLKDSLPGWQVIGLEISPKAIKAASAKHTDIDFQLFDDTNLASIQADFVFTHHVLEHVVDLDHVWEQTRTMCGPGASVLHILPCGDAGSFEHWLVARQRGGIDPIVGNRFFYEDPGHLRRLTWRGLCDAAAAHGFEPTEVRYANRFWGGLRWISKISPDKARAIAQPEDARTPMDRLSLLVWHGVLGTLAHVNRWSNVWAWRREHGKGLRGLAGLIIGLPTGIIGKLTAGALDHLAEREWQRGKAKTGSEMYALVRLADAGEQAQDAVQRQAA